MGQLKQILQTLKTEFNISCLSRDMNKCVMCGRTEDLVVHNIIDRHELQMNGLVQENGITLCPMCHNLAEEYHKSMKMEFVPGYHPDQLFAKINSSYEKAVEASQALEDKCFKHK